jgi:hypothetical protein
MCVGVEMPATQIVYNINYKCTKQRHRCFHCIITNKTPQATDLMMLTGLRLAWFHCTAAAAAGGRKERRKEQHRDSISIIAGIT